MDDHEKTREQLLTELSMLRQRMTTMECQETSRELDRLRLTQTAMDHSLDAAFWVDPDAHFFYVNDTACRMLGYTRDELLTMTVFDVDANFTTSRWANCWKVLQHSWALTIESRFRTKAGHIIPVEITSNYLGFNGHSYSCAFIRDITDRKRAEEALRQSELKHRALVEGSLQGIAIISGDGRCLFANQAFTEMFGAVEPEDVIGCRMSQFVAPHEQARLSAYREARLSGWRRCAMNSRGSSSTAHHSGLKRSFL